MTLQSTVKTIQNIALTQHNVNYVGSGDIYADLNANPNLKYGIVYITQNQHTSTEETDQYNFNIFYIDRLANFEGDNRLQIQSTGKEVLENIIRIFCDTYDAEIYGDIYWQSFTERFSDLCAGIFCTVTLEIMKNTICAE